VHPISDQILIFDEFVSENTGLIGNLAIKFS
jgi:hypothetical protein